MATTTVERQTSFDRQFDSLLKTLGVPFDKMQAKELSTLERTTNGDHHEISMDISQFDPQDVSIKVTGRQIVIEAKHNEKKENGGCLTTRNFVRKYSLPADCNPNDVRSSLSPSGVLTVISPRSKQITNGEHVVPIATSPFKRI